MKISTYFPYLASRASAKFMHEEKPSARIEIESRKEKGGRNFFSDRTRGAPTESMGQEGSRGQILHPVIEVMMHWRFAIRAEEKTKGRGRRRWSYSVSHKMGSDLSSGRPSGLKPDRLFGIS